MATPLRITLRVCAMELLQARDPESFTGELGKAKAKRLIFQCRTAGKVSEVEREIRESMAEQIQQAGMAPRIRVRDVRALAYPDEKKVDIQFLSGFGTGEEWAVAKEIAKEAYAELADRMYQALTAPPADSPSGQADGTGLDQAEFTALLAGK